VLYAVCAIALVAALLGAARLTPSAAGWTAAAEIVGGFFVAIVSAAVMNDASDPPQPGLPWARAFERGWAVIIIGFAVDLCSAVGLGGLASPSIFGKLLSAGIVLVAVSLTFATVDALVSEDPWYALLPGALARSMTVAWRGATFSRAMLAFAVGNLGMIWLDLVLTPFFAHAHLAYGEVWASGLSTVVFLAPVQTFAAIVYLDAIGYGSKHTCGR
jgi:hypothetical protein